MKIFAPKFNGYKLQDSGNYFMDNIIYFHDLVLVILFFISILVIWFLYKIIIYFIFPIYFIKLNMIIDITVIYLSIYYYNITRICSVFYSRILKVIEYFPFLDLKMLNHTKNILKNSLRFNNFVELKKFNKFFKVRIHTYYYFYYLNDLYDFIEFNDIEYRYYFYSDVKLEFLWTLFPSIILFLLAIPSFGLLFSVEKVSAPELTVKVIGHQWYWEYQYMDYINYKEIIETDSYKFIYLNKKEDNYILESYMIADEDLEKGQMRLLEVDKKLILPLNTSIRLLITSDDVLHSWAVPSLGIKVDACPGRLNEIIIKIRENGIYYGQCSELCGWYHGFMPIVIQTLSKEDFKYWAVASFLDVKYIKKNEIK